MEITLNVDVESSEGLIGRSTYVIVNPISQNVTHLVVRSHNWPHTERLAPTDLIEQSSHDGITLRCSLAEFERMEAFVETEFIKVDIPHYTDAGFGWPYVRTTYEEQRKPVQHMHIPLHTRELRRGTPVMALDGRVGRVDELIVGPRNKHITHIVVHQGHLFNQKDTVIPLGAIESIEDELILLNLDQKGVEALPLVPIHRHFTPVAI